MGILFELLKLFAPMIMMALTLLSGVGDGSDPAAAALIAGRAHAGRGAVDCGRAKSTNADALDECMADALVTRKAFVGLLVEQGIDSAVGRVYAGDASGDVREYHYDSDPSGGGGIGLAGSSVYVTQCVGAHVEVLGTETVRRIACPDDGRGPQLEPIGGATYK